jgi:hypothetical protein
MLEPHAMAQNQCTIHMHRPSGGHAGFMCLHGCSVLTCCGLQVTTLLAAADKRVAEGGAAWLEEAQAAADAAAAAAEAEATQGDKIRELKDAQKAAGSAEEKDSLNQQVQQEVKALKALKAAAADAQDKCAPRARAHMHAHTCTTCMKCMHACALVRAGCALSAGCGGCPEAARSTTARTFSAGARTSQSVGSSMASTTLARSPTSTRCAPRACMHAVPVHACMWCMHVAHAVPRCPRCAVEALSTRSATARACSSCVQFGPTFRAEESHTSRHLAEFWMIEPEMAFCTLQDDMQCAEDYVRHCCAHVLRTCQPDLAFLADRCAPAQQSLSLLRSLPPSSCHPCAL